MDHDRHLAKKIFDRLAGLERWWAFDGKELKGPYTVEELKAVPWVDNETELLAAIPGPGNDMGEKQYRLTETGVLPVAIVGINDANEVVDIGPAESKGKLPEWSEAQDFIEGLGHTG